MGIDDTLVASDSVATNQIVHKLRFFCIFSLGFSSGLPFLLILSTLSIWLAESGISKTQIGVLAWVTVPYSLKFLVSPLIDSYPLPILNNFFGKRRSWMFSSQLMLVAALLALGAADPKQGLGGVTLAAFAVGLFSAVQDIAYEAYRIEILTKQQCGLGASCSVLGYRVGMLCSGAGAIYIAAFFDSWSMAYSIMALFMVPGILTTLLIKESFVDEKVSNFKQIEEIVEEVYYKKYNIKVKNWIHTVLFAPVKTFVANREWWIILPFIMCYKVSDTVLNAMSMPFLLEIGFNKIQIAHVAKTFGIMSMISGGLAGGALIWLYSMRSILILSLLLQLLASGLFIIQAILGDNLTMLFVTMGVENFCCGLGQVALITYLSKLCSQPHTAMHYAILSSFASIVRVNFSALSGWLADSMLWTQFYSLVCLSCLPGIILLIIREQHFVDLE